MNSVKSISSLLAVATILGSINPNLHADSSAEILPYLYAGNPASTVEYSKKLTLGRQQELRDSLIALYGTEVQRLLPLHAVHPKDISSFLAQIAPNIRKKDRRHHLMRLFGLGIATLSTLTCAVATTGENSKFFGNLTTGMLGISSLSVARLLNKEGFLSGYRKLPVTATQSLGFMQARGLRKALATELGEELHGLLLDPEFGWRLPKLFATNNNKVEQLANLAASLEAGYSRKQLMIAAAGGAVLLGAITLYALISSVRSNTKAATAALGAGALGGVLSVLQGAPFLSPIVSSKLNYWQSEYRNELAKVSAATK